MWKLPTTLTSSSSTLSLTTAASLPQLRRRRLVDMLPPLLLLQLLLPPRTAYGYAIHDVNRRDICGVWRLTSQRSFLPKIGRDGPREMREKEDARAATTTTTSTSAEIWAAHQRRPMKEFTVYPKKITTMTKKTKAVDTNAHVDNSEEEEEEEILLMLSEDGSFVQYGAISSSDIPGDDDEDDEDDGDDDDGAKKGGALSGSGQFRLDAKGMSSYSSSSSSSSRSPHQRRGESNGGSVMGMLGIMRGTWDFLDGKLILAADRPDGNYDIRNVRDTMLVGNVVVKEERSLEDNPALPKSVGEGRDEKNEKEGGEAGDDDDDDDDDGEDRGKIDAMDGETNDAGKEGGAGDTSSFGVKSTTTMATTTNSAGSIDVRLSVPEGSVEIGRFMYPKRHPSFFEQPMFKPIPTGKFQLRQVLGTLNTRTSENDEESSTEKFRPEDLMGKRYFLTSYPIQRKRGGKKRWSIKYNKFVEDVKKQSDEEKEREESMPVPIRTMELELFPNMTFCTFAGFGSAKILRGKWSIIGYDKDQFWMQIFRFGFGRSVSGSTYSEGAGLTKDDEKAYWGSIVEVGKGEDKNGGEESVRTEIPLDGGGTPPKARAVEINGSVLDGWGLEPTTVAWFTMIEKTEDALEDDDDGDDLDDADDDDAFDGGSNSDASFLERWEATASAEGDGDEDDLFSSLDAFQ